MGHRRVYMDHSATTPVREEVAEAMEPYATVHFGNASSLHAEGRRARDALEEARATVASCLGASSEEIYFTSGGTEGDNLALKGTAWRWEPAACHVLTTSVEHHAVLRTCEYLADSGYPVEFLPVNSGGRVELATVDALLRGSTRLVSVMAANNEVGTIQPIAGIGALLRNRNTVFHVDAVQALGKITVDLTTWNADLVAFSGHKIHGPKGIGVLYIRRGVELLPLFHGGHHEGGSRAGTESVAAAVGMAKAVELAVAEVSRLAAHTSRLRDHIEQGICRAIPEITVNADPAHRLPNILNISIKYIEGESLILSLDREGIAAATGSACTSGSAEPSHVLLAMGVEPSLAHGSLRLSLGRENTSGDADHLLNVLPAITRKLRSLSPLTPKALL